jgi:SAM-dependent methyltransferase
MIKELSDDPVIKDYHPLPEMNTTCAYYPILIYLIGKINHSLHILEIGTEIGYGTYYLAQIAAQNGGNYYGVDILPDKCEKAQETLNLANLVGTIICADTKKMDKIDFMDRIDLAFLDGEHTTEAVAHEIEMIYPKLNDQGWGYIFIHDIIDMGNADVWLKYKQDPRFEALGFNANYGLGILRKIEGLDFEDIAKRYGKQSLGE